VLNVLATPNVSQGEFKADYLGAFDKANRPKIGIAINYKATQEVRNAFEKAVEILGSLGCETLDIEAPLDVGFNFTTIERDRETIDGLLFKDIELLVLPTTTDVPPTIEDVKKSGNAQAVSPDNTFFCNYYGLPAISLPCGFSQNGLPLAFQMVGPQWSESAILNMAHLFQGTTNWHMRHPID
jgi:aspartyl-tRNA(Asn)/glutamyl-tRNA(Gln) amidotransferase subunit A